MNQGKLRLKEENFLIDAHCHILPWLDDGAENLEISLELARQLVLAGFDKVIATPHVLEGREFIDPEAIRESVARLNAELMSEDIPLEILPGAENYIFPELPRYLKEGRILTLGDSHKYLLFELPMQNLPSYTEQVIFELQVQGIVPVLAHPERYQYFSESPETLLEWKYKGVLMQIDLRSLEGRYGKGPQDLVIRMLEKGLVDLVGTDAHRGSHQNDGFKKAIDNLREIIGEERFNHWFDTNPQAILQGKEIKFNDEELPSISLQYSGVEKRNKKSIIQKVQNLFHKSR